MVMAPLPPSLWSPAVRAASAAPSSRISAIMAGRSPSIAIIRARKPRDSSPPSAKKVGVPPLSPAISPIRGNACPHRRRCRGRAGAADPAGQQRVDLRTRCARVARPGSVGPPVGDQPRRAGVPGRGLRPTAARRRRRQHRQPARPERLAADPEATSPTRSASRDSPPRPKRWPRRWRRASASMALRPARRCPASGQTEEGFRRLVDTPCRSAARPTWRNSAAPSAILSRTRSITGQVIALDGGQHLG